MFAGIQNYYERLVFEEIKRVLFKDQSEYDADYMEDIACVALNHLPPRYVRHAVDLTSHLTDTEIQDINKEVSSAVDYAITLTGSWRTKRDDES